MLAIVRLRSVITLLTILSLRLALAKDVSRIPIVLWHGMGDSGKSSGMQGVKQQLEDWYGPEDLLVYLITIGGADEAADKKAGFFDLIDRQVEEVCEDLKTVPGLENGFNAIGFSQGGLFMRAYVQKCNDPPVKTLMTFGSPHSGVADIPNCQNMESPSASCSLMRSIVKNGVYWGWIQNSVVQAQYFRRWQNLDAYYSGNIFLPDLNQEGPFVQSNPLYADNLATLDRLVLVRFMNDTMIDPKDSAWFSNYNSDGLVEDIHDQDWYKNGGLGLKNLEKKGRIDFLTLPGHHMQIPMQDFKIMVDKYFMRPAAQQALLRMDN